MVKPGYWRQSTFHCWQELAAEADRAGPWPEFSLWADLMRKGLRKPALQAMHLLVQHAHEWPMVQRRQFAIWLMRASYKRKELIVPHPLAQDFLKPVMAAWIAESPWNAVPYRWLGLLTGDLEYLRKSILLDPNEQIAREVFVSLATGLVEYSVHELPARYIGAAAVDSDLLRETAAVAQGVTLPDLQAYLVGEVEPLQQVVDSYLEYISSTREETFSQWAAATGKDDRVREDPLLFPPDAYERLCRADEQAPWFRLQGGGEN